MVAKGMRDVAMAVATAVAPWRQRRRPQGRPAVTPTGRAREIGADDIIVSKTDPKGRITYANRLFVDISGYREAELLGAPHSILRHPAMPRAVFRLLWERIGSGREIFAYVVNLCRSGDHYWVLAHVTPSLDGGGAVVGYHSMRRRVAPGALAVVEPLYATLRAVEAGAPDRGAGLAASAARLEAYLRDEAGGRSYDEFVFALERDSR